MRKRTFKVLTKDQGAELDALEALPDDRIETSEIRKS